MNGFFVNLPLGVIEEGAYLKPDPKRGYREASASCKIDGTMEVLDSIKISPPADSLLKVVKVGKDNSKTNVLALFKRFEDIFSTNQFSTIDELEEAVSQYYGPIHPDTPEGREQAELRGVLKVYIGYFVVRPNTSPDLLLGYSDDYVLTNTAQ